MTTHPAYGAALAVLEQVDPAAADAVREYVRTLRAECQQRRHEIAQLREETSR